MNVLSVFNTLYAFILCLWLKYGVLILILSVSGLCHGWKNSSISQISIVSCSWTHYVSETDISVHYSLVQNTDRTIALIHFGSVAVGVTKCALTQSLHALRRQLLLCSRSVTGAVSEHVYLISLSWITLWLWSNYFFAQEGPCQTNKLS